MLSREKLINVYLYGPLGEQFGSEHQFIISTPQEAIRALSANYPDFRRELVKHARYGLYVDGDWRDGEEAAILPVSREVHFVPMVEGGAFAAPLLGVAIGGTTLGAIGTQILIGVVVSALVWGVSQLFAKPAETEEAEMADSYIFSGAENTTSQGSAVPVIYGRCYVGSVVVSAGLSVGDQQIVSGSGGRSAMLEGRGMPQEVGAQEANRGRSMESPALVLQNVGSEDSPIMRVGPEGWRHVGMVALLEEDQYREVDLFVPPEAGMPYRWDYWRGFERYQPGEQGMLGT